MRTIGACFAEAAKAVLSCFHPPDIRGRQVRLRRTLGVLIVLGRDKLSHLKHRARSPILFTHSHRYFLCDD